MLSVLLACNQGAGTVGLREDRGEALGRSTLMESGDGGWIRAGATQPGGDDGSPGDEWTEDGWPTAAAAEPAAGPLTGKRWGHGGVPGFSAWVAAAVAVVAAAAGVAAGFFLIS
jgi:hypothetical protein